MNYGNLIIRIGIGLLFIWGGIEKFFVGFVGGVGLEHMAATLAKTGWSFLGDTGTYILAILLAATELLAGVLIILNKKIVLSYFYVAFLMLVALVTIYIPNNNWMYSMIHIALLTTPLGLALNQYQKGVSLLKQP